MKIMDKASDSNDSSVAQVVGRKVLSRTLWLLIGAFLGLALIGVLFFYLMPAFFEASIQGRTSYAIAVRLVPLVIMLVGSVPVTVLLWLFRTHDVTRQNELSRQSNDQSTFAHALDLVLTGKPEARGVGLAILVQIFKLADNDLKSRIKPAVRNAIAIEKDKILMNDMKVEGLDLKDGYFFQAEARSTKFFNCWMSDANLACANLRYTQFSNVKMDGANLSGAICSGAMLEDTSMEGCLLGELDITCTNGPNLSSSRLEGVNLANAGIYKTSFVEAELYCVDMSLKEVEEVVFREVDFSKAVLDDVDFTDRVMQTVDFTQAILKNVKFMGATLEDVKFNKANLAGADLSLASLKPQGIDFKEATLSDGEKCVKLPYQSLQEALKEHPSLKHAKGDAQYLPPR